MKIKHTTDLIIASLVGIVLHFAGAPFWFAAMALISTVFILSAIRMLMAFIDMLGEALDTIVLILKNKQQ